MKTFLAAVDVASETLWRKGGRSGAAGHCVELAEVDGGVAIRQSKAPQQGAFVYSPEEARAFILSIKDGDFDDLI